MRGRVLAGGKGRPRGARLWLRVPPSQESRVGCCPVATEHKGLSFVLQGVREATLSRVLRCCCIVFHKRRGPALRTPSDPCALHQEAGGASKGVRRGLGVPRLPFPECLRTGTVPSPHWPGDGGRPLVPTRRMAGPAGGITGLGPDFFMALPCGEGNPSDPLGLNTVCEYR